MFGSREYFVWFTCKGRRGTVTVTGVSNAAQAYHQARTLAAAEAKALISEIEITNMKKL